MTLRKSTVLTIGIMFVLVLLSAFLVNRYFLLDNFTKLENERFSEDTQRVVSVLNNRVDGLASSCSDWAFWDDTYKFVTDLNPDYIRINLAPTTFVSLKLSAILFTDKEGNIVYCRAYDIEQNEQIPVPASLIAYVSQSDLLKFPANPDDFVAGVINLPENPLLVASCPIMTSTRTGPVRGALIMARSLDAKELELVSQTTLLPLTCYPVTSQNLPPDFKRALPRLTAAGSSIYVTSLDSITIYGYALVEDIYQKPVLILRAEAPRTIYQEGKQAILFTMLFIAISITVGVIVAILFQDKRVISPLVKLRNDVHRISTSGNVYARVELKGKDELAALANDINAMLSTIQGHREEEKKWRQDLEAEIKRRAEYTRELIHELKSPITPILSSGELLVEGLKEEPWSRLVKNVYRGALDMNDRLDDLVDMARGEMGTLQLRIEPLDMLSLIRQMAEEMSPLITSHYQSLVLDLPSSLCLVRGDEVRLRQVLRNLLSNATKNTQERGTITIRAKDGSDNVVIEVADDGRGIPADKLGHIFEPRVLSIDNPAGRSSGLGLGLRLSKTLVELHGGSIWVKSEPGRGSTFSFSIPAANSAREDGDKAS